MRGVVDIGIELPTIQRDCGSNPAMTDYLNVLYISTGDRSKLIYTAVAEANTKTTRRMYQCTVLLDEVHFANGFG